MIPNGFQQGDHPRACGEHRTYAAEMRGWMGPSPRRLVRDGFLNSHGLGAVRPITPCPPVAATRVSMTGVIAAGSFPRGDGALGDDTGHGPATGPTALVGHAMRNTLAPTRPGTLVQQAA